MPAFTKTFAILVALAATAVAVPTDLLDRSAQATADIQLCESFNFINCSDIQVATVECHNLVKNISFLNKEISSAIISQGFFCTFFENLFCAKEGAPVVDFVGLDGGSWANFSSLPGDGGTIDFDKQTSSLICSTVN